MMKKFAAAESGIAGLGKAGLQRFDLGVFHKIRGALVTAGGRCELSGKNRRATGRAIHAGGVGVGEVHAARGKFVDVWRQRSCGRF